MSATSSAMLREKLAAAETHRRAGRIDQAIALYLEITGGDERPDGDLCLRLAQCYLRIGDAPRAFAWLARIADPPISVDDADRAAKFSTWHAAAALIDDLLRAQPSLCTRRVRVALIGSYTLAQLGPMLRLAALRYKIALDVHTGQFGQYRQEIIDPQSDLYRAQPEVV